MTSAVVRRYVETIGDGASNKFMVTHDLHTMHAMVQLYLTVNWELTDLATIRLVSLDEVEIDFSHILYYDPTNPDPKERLGYGEGWIPPKDGVRVVVFG